MTSHKLETATIFDTELELQDIIEKLSLISYAMRYLLFLHRLQNQIICL